MAGFQIYPGDVALLPPDLEQLYLEDQGAVGLYLAGATVAITQLCRDIQLPFRAFLHELQGLLPALDHPIRAKGRGLVAAMVTGV